MYDSWTIHLHTAWPYTVHLFNKKPHWGQWGWFPINCGSMMGCDNSDVQEGEKWRHMKGDLCHSHHQPFLHSSHTHLGCFHPEALYIPMYMGFPRLWGVQKELYAGSFIHILAKSAVPPPSLSPFFIWLGLKGLGTSERLPNLLYNTSFRQLELTSSGAWLELVGEGLLEWGARVVTSSFSGSVMFSYCAKPTF